MTEIEFVGTGGQGSVVAGKLLADAAVKAGHNSQAFSSYGALRRGGEVESYVRLSGTLIRSHSKIYGADYTVIMSDNMITDVQKKGKLKKGATVLINTSKTAEAFPSLKDFKVVVVDANRIALRKGLALPSGIPIINTAVLGALCGLLPSVQIEHLAEAFKEGQIPASERNIEAAREAYHSIQQSSARSASPKTVEAEAIVESLMPECRPKQSPCEADCPAGENIRKTAYLVQLGRFAEALESIRQENPLPGVCGRVCFHPCETNCNRAEYDQGIATNALERAASDYSQHGKLRVPPGRPLTGKKVAIVGSGPAGLTAAYFLRLLGHSPTVFEREPAAGGVPRFGIPAYRLPKEVVDRDLSDIESLGVEVRLDTAVGRDVPFDRLVRDYDACLVAAGAHRPIELDVPGGNSRVVLSGLDLLKKAALGQKAELGSSVVVIGGGNTAIDAARTAKRLGASDVAILYRRTAKEMPAHHEEVAAARREGVRFSFLTIPIEVRGGGRGPSQVECLRTKLGEKDKDGRRHPEPVAGSNFTVPADAVISALGEEVEASFLPAGVKRARGVVEVDECGRTSVPGVYAAGDIASTERSVVQAIASGKRAALGIDLFLQGTSPDAAKAYRKGRAGAVSMIGYLAGSAATSEEALVNFKDLNTDHFQPAPRQEAPRLSAKAGLQGFAETSPGLSRHQAVAEAERCFQCGSCTLCETCYISCPDIAISFLNEMPAFNSSQDICKSCGICVHECPRGVISWKGVEA